MITILEDAGPNPVGEYKPLPEVETFLKEVYDLWHGTKVKTSFLSRCFGFGKNRLIDAAKILIFSLDALIVLVDKLIPAGADKKATVLTAMAVMYDFVIKETLPMWLLPWAGGIKTFVIYTVISLFIDHIVGKYKTGIWKS